MSDSQVQRAELLADLGRYGEAAAELADAEPGDAAAQTLLARVKLAAGAPREALAAADAAVAAAPDHLEAMIARGMVLADLGRGDEAAAQAERILQQGSGDGYACTSAAAILSQARNGQLALDAAWEGVRLTPDQPRAHLVLGVVAAGLGMDDIASRAYREALELDPNLPVAQAALGVARLEQHRYAEALSHLADQQPAGPGRLNTPTRPATRPRPAASPRPEPAPSPTESRPRAVHYATAYAIFAPLLTAWAYAVGVGAGPVAVVLAVGGVATCMLAWARLAERDGRRFPRMRRHPAAVATIAGLGTVPLVLLAFAALGQPWLLAVAVAAGVVPLVAARRLH